MLLDIDTDVVVVGGGGCGLVAALTAAERGCDVIVLEKTARTLGNTAASGGMIPACGTRFQKDKGIFDDVEQMMGDILHKNQGQSDPSRVRALCERSGELVEWLADAIDVPLELVTEFRYPGHSTYRMHATPTRSGQELMGYLRSAVDRNRSITLQLHAEVKQLILGDDGGVAGVRVVSKADGELTVGARKVILACNGFGGNREMVRTYIPEIADAEYFGYEANTGEAIRWGLELGAAVDSMGAYQGHASVAVPYGILISWGTVMNGGFLVNVEGERFGNETKGYSEYACEVLRQPTQTAFVIIDRPIRDSLMKFEDFRRAVELGALKEASSPEELAAKLGVNEVGFRKTLDDFNKMVRGQLTDPFGRTQFSHPLKPPLYGVKVKPALFHTQGGLKTDCFGRVCREGGGIIPNLYAGGGAAAGISGNTASGYLSGNGLLAALGWGRIAGEHAAKCVASES